MNAIDRVTAHLTSLQVRHIDVDEWGEKNKPFRIYWKPWSVAEKREFFDKSPTNNVERFADVILHKALDSGGKNLFEAVADREKMLRGGHESVVSYVGLSILQDAEPLSDQKVDNAKGN